MRLPLGSSCIGDPTHGFTLVTLTLAVVTLGSFAASFVNAAFATGGVYIMLLSTLAVLPVSAAIPLQSAFAAGSLAARIHYFRAHIQWPIVGAFVAGSLIGVYFGAASFVALPEVVIEVLLGAVLLVLTWWPQGVWRLRMRHPFALVGVVHSYLGTLFGVGGVLQPMILRTGLTKLQITGTLAACLILLDGLKVASYVGFGFSYWAYVPHILLATAAGFAGTWAGKRVAHRVSERAFRRVFRWFITLVALRFLIAGFWSLVAA